MTVSEYRFVPCPEHWDDSCHKYPCPETRRIDAVLNRMKEDEKIQKRWTYRLSPDEVKRAWADARALQRNREQWRLKDKFDLLDYQESRLYVDANSRGGEICVSRLTGLRLNPIMGCMVSPDLESNYQVRTTHYLRGHLNIHKKKPHASDYYILCIGKLPTYFAAGWIVGKDGMREEFDDPNLREPGWAVPQWELHSMDDLPMPNNNANSN